jgi:hypothetical protein
MKRLYFLVRKIVAVAVSTVVILVATLMVIGGAAAVVIPCIDSATLRNKAKKQLTPEELETLESAGGICPDVYVFKRDGVNQCIMLDFDGFGCG